MIPTIEVLQNYKMIPYETIVINRFLYINLGNEKWYTKFIMITMTMTIIKEKTWFKV